jgi:hypothetical protein
LLEGVLENPETKIEELWTFNFYAGIPMPRFQSSEANENPLNDRSVGSIRGLIKLEELIVSKGVLTKGEFIFVLSVGSSSRVRSLEDHIAARALSGSVLG